MCFFPINAALFVMGCKLRNKRAVMLRTGICTDFCPAYAFPKMCELVLHSISKTEVQGSLE